MKRKGFTLIELLVSVGILAMVISFAGVIFRISIDSYRESSANAEIMQKLRAITDQLNRDFQGLQKGSPVLIQFYQRDGERFDQIMFFADGDFHSIQLYENTTGRPHPDGDDIVSGNMARIHYGQARVDGLDPNEQPPEDRILSRRGHVLTADATLANWPAIDLADIDDPIPGDGRRANEGYEHDGLSLAEWETIDIGVYQTELIPHCFDFRPEIDMDDPNTYHKLMCDGLSSFSVQWAYWHPTDDRVYWFPSDNPDGDNNTNDSHFTLIGNLFGTFFNIAGTRFGDWYSIGEVEYETGQFFAADVFPRALKFTLKLYDSKGIIKEPREFTHIIYLSD